MRRVALALAVLGLAACDTAVQEATQKKLDHGGGMVCRDEADGSRWFISRHTRNVYTVKPIQPIVEEPTP